MSEINVLVIIILCSIVLILSLTYASLGTRDIFMKSRKDGSYENPSEVSHFFWLADIVDTTALSPTPPVFGILSQPFTFNKSHGEFHKGDQYQQYIAASYVKWLEAVGIRSIPIPFDATDPQLLDDLFQQINGLFLPGGSGNGKLPYAARYMLSRAHESNNGGVPQQIELHNNTTVVNDERVFFPVWGTCLGFEYIVQFYGSGQGEQPSQHVLDNDFDAENISLPLLLSGPFGSSQLYDTKQIYDIARNYNVSLNNHHLGISPTVFKKNAYLPLYFDMTSTNFDRSGKPFVSTIEGREMPVYGVQYHPEKNSFEYGMYPNSTIPYEAIDHSEQGILFSLHIANFVGRLGRRAVVEQQRYNKQIEQHSLRNIQVATSHAYTNPSRYPTTTTYPIVKGIAFEEVYIVPSASHWSQPTSAPPSHAVAHETMIASRMNKS